MMMWAYFFFSMKTQNTLLKSFLLQYFKVTDQELFQHDVYERFGFEYSENTVDHGFLRQL